MDNLPKNLAEVRLYISRIRPWAAVAMLGAAVLLGFYTFQALQYWEAWNDTKVMTREIEQINRKLDRGVPSSEEVAQTLAANQKRSEYLEGLFLYSDIASIMGIISDTSWDTGVDLPSIAAGDPRWENIDGMEYKIQALNVTAQGPLSDIYRFMAALHERIKVVSVPSVNIANPGTERTTAQVQLNFYLSPEPIVKEEGAD